MVAKRTISPLREMSNFTSIWYNFRKKTFVLMLLVLVHSQCHRWRVLSWTGSRAITSRHCCTKSLCPLMSRPMYQRYNISIYIRSMYIIILAGVFFVIFSLIPFDLLFLLLVPSASERTADRLGLGEGTYFYSDIHTLLDKQSSYT